MNKVEFMVKNTSLGGFRKLIIEGPFNENTHRVSISTSDSIETIYLTPDEWMKVAKIINEFKL